PFRRYFVVAAVVLGVGARIDERAVDPGAIVGRDRERGVGEYVAARVLEFRDALRALRMIGRQAQRAIQTLGRRPGQTGRAGEPRQRVVRGLDALLRAVDLG